MEHETSSDNCDIVVVEFHGTHTDPVTPLAPADFWRIKKTRDKYVQAGLMDELPASVLEQYSAFSPPKTDAESN